MALPVRESYGGEQSDRAQVQAIADFKENRYDSASDTLTFSAMEMDALKSLCGYYGSYLGDHSYTSNWPPSRS